MEKKQERAFVRKDVEAFFNERWGVDAEPTNELISISLVPGIKPGGWELLYRSTYHYPGHDPYTRDWTIIVLQHDEGPDGPWLNVEVPRDLPAGLHTTEDEDREIKRRKDAEMAEWRRQREAAEQANKEKGDE